jgi:hypothetical protein
LGSAYLHASAIYIKGKNVKNMPRGIYDRSKSLPNKTIYKIGHKQTPEARLKMRLAKLGIYGEMHNSWKGEKAKYGSKHDWIERSVGYAKKCSVCSLESENHRSVEWCNISLNYKRELSDYISLCRSCHRKWDYGVIALKIKGVIYKRPLIFKGSGSTKYKDRWMAQCTINKKHFYLGIHASKELADTSCIEFRKKFEPEIMEIK